MYYITIKMASGNNYYLTTGGDFADGLQDNVLFNYAPGWGEIKSLIGKDYIHYINNIYVWNFEDEDEETINDYKIETVSNKCKVYVNGLLLDTIKY